jgi:Protein of unknown function (DUF3500)
MDKRIPPKGPDGVRAISGASGTAAVMSEAASRLLDTLDERQPRQAAFGFPGEPERSRWFYTPPTTAAWSWPGAPPAQVQAAVRLLTTGLSPSGYHQAAAIMSHELILERLEDWPALPGWGRVRDPPGTWWRCSATPRPGSGAGGSPGITCRCTTPSPAAS